jgi:hypothetical protein
MSLKNFLAIAETVMYGLIVMSLIIVVGSCINNISGNWSSQFLANHHFLLQIVRGWATGSALFFVPTLFFGIFLMVLIARSGYGSP